MTGPKFVVTICVTQVELIDLMNFKHGEVWNVIIAKEYEDYIKSLATKEDKKK